MRNALPYSDRIDVQSFVNIFDNTTNSYKYYWMYAIIEEIKKGNHCISFRKLVLRMIAQSWYPLIEFHLNFGSLDNLGDIVHVIHRKYNFDKDIKKEELVAELEKIEDEEIEKKIKDFYKYVPYRLLAPFFKSELRGVKDHKKNAFIRELSNQSGNGVYRIVKEREPRIEIYDNWLEYLQANMGIIEGWLKYNLIDFLQTRNPNVPAIPFKLEPQSERKLGDQKKLWKEFIDYHNAKDIYTGQLLRKEDLSLDHFIPWSFVLHDKNWNLMPTVQTVNSSKSDQLPVFEKYIHGFTDLQYRVFDFCINQKKEQDKIRKRIIEEYSELDSRIDGNIQKGTFIKILQDNIKPLYKIAENQGFQKWEYRAQ